LRGSEIEVPLVSMGLKNASAAAGSRPQRPSDGTPKPTPRRSGVGSDAKRIDLYREHRTEYAASRDPAIVRVGPALYLVVKGAGAPGGPRFHAAMGSLFGAAYTLKFMLKAQGFDFKVSGPEGLWDLPAVGVHHGSQSVSQLPWRLILRVPDRVTKADLTEALRQLEARGKAAVVPVALERIREGLCAQVLHVGPYSEENRTVAALGDWARRSGYSIAWPHHEIYLSDPGRVKPSKLKTILRYPVRRMPYGA
jgi:hypothetical protein